MRSIDEILELARQLPPEDRRRLLDKLEDSLAEEEPVPSETSAEGPYTALLEMAGTAHSDFTDVSTDKYKHLAEAYADQRDEG